jgi:F-type H+-transporting ATPase subunit delta
MADATNTLEATGAKARIARVYAEALFGAASKANQADVIGDELDAVTSVVKSNPGIAAFLSGNLVNKSKKLPILASAFERNTSETFRKFLGVLNENNRLGLIPAIRAEYHDLQDAKAGKVRVKVTAAVALLDTQIEHLKANLAKQLNATPILEIAINSDILGGLILQVGDKVYDTSVRSRLENLRTHLTTSGTHG